MRNGLEFLWGRQSISAQHAAIIVGEVHGAARAQIVGLERVAPEYFVGLMRELSRPYTIKGGWIDQLGAEYRLRPNQVARIRGLVAMGCFDRT